MLHADYTSAAVRFGNGNHLHTRIWTRNECIAKKDEYWTFNIARCLQNGVSQPLLFFLVHEPEF